MKWGHPPIIKIYEALGAVADDRVEVEENHAKVYSSSRNKFYEVTFDREQNAIMANDNGSYWKGYLGYPSIAFLLKENLLEYRPKLGELLKGIAWKDINQKYTNDFDKTLAEILNALTSEQAETLNEYVLEIDKNVNDMSLSLLGKKTQPPKGY